MGLSKNLFRMRGGQRARRLGLHIVGERTWTDF